MAKTVMIGGRPVGNDHPVYVIAEIGINHNGSLDNALRLIDAAVKAGCDAVKFQKRTPEKCVPPDQRSKMRETPWGSMTYLDYRYKVEFGEPEYREIDRYCRDKAITWFVSPWDVDSVAFMEKFDTPCYKIPSALVTDTELLKAVRSTGRPVILSTGMSTMEEIRAAVSILGLENLVITHCTSTYPCDPKELNLRTILSLKREFPCPIGYSGHEVGLPTTVAAVAMGACCVERHVTLDRAMWGSDQAASLEPQGLERLVKYVRVVEQSLGDGIKRVYESELPVMKRLRRVVNSAPSY